MGSLIKYFILFSLFMISFAVNALSQSMPASMTNSKPVEVFGNVENQTENSENATEEKTSNLEKNNEEQPVTEVKKDDVIIADSKEFEWDNKPEPQKNDNNLMRIKYKNNNVNLTSDDILALSSMLKLAEQNNTNQIKVKSFASLEETPQKTRQKAIIRVLSLKDELLKNSFDFDKKADVFIYPAVSKSGSDYIDIDKD